MSKVGLIVPTLNEGRLLEVWLKEFDRQTRKLNCLLTTSNRNPKSGAGGKETMHIDQEDTLGASANIARLPAQEWHSIRRLEMGSAKRFFSQIMTTEYANLYGAMLVSYSSVVASAAWFMERG